MAKTVLNVKTDIEVKKAAQKLAKQMGVPLSIIVNAQLKRFVDERRFEVQAPLVPSASLKKAIRQFEKDLREGNKKAFSPAFTSGEEMDKWLEGNL